MPSLAELNRARRDYAYSGRATIGDTPWLYALQEAQAAANAPAGIGEQGGMGDEAAAPNPLPPAPIGGPGGGVGGGGGGASGAADTGMPGPGQTGLGPEADEAFRSFMMAREGGQAGEPGGVGDNYSENPYADPSGFGTVGSIGDSLFGIRGLGLLGAGIGAAYDYELANQFDPNYDASLGSYLSSFGNIATGGAIGDSQLAEAMHEAGLFDAARAGAVFGGEDYSEVGPSGINVAVDRSGEIVTSSPAPGSPAGAGFGSGGAQESSFGGRSQPRDTSPGRRGARESTRQLSPRERREYGGGWSPAGGIDGGGGAAGGVAEANRDEAAGRGAGPGGFGAGHAGPGGGTVLHEGGYLDEGMVPGQARADVPVTMQEGEGVLTADAMEMLGEDFVNTTNALARVMRGRIERGARAVNALARMKERLR